MQILDLTDRKPKEELEKLPKPTNSNLNLLFVNIDTVVIKDDGVYNGKAMSDKILLTITDQNKVRQFAKLLEIDETNTGFYCMCLGTYAIELYSNSNLKETIGFHHETSIRYEKWNGDAQLAKSDDLVEFLSQQGFTKPLQDKLETKREAEIHLAEQQKWLELAPKCFLKYWYNIFNVHFPENVFANLINDLDIEIPDKQSQIIILLKLFGTTKNFWTAYPSYESVPNNILKKTEVKKIIETCKNSDKSDEIQRGLGRFLCSFEFKKTRKNSLKDIPLEVISDLEICFDNIGEKRGINEIFSLRNEKNNS